jgi:hypothetical protein
MNNVFLFNVDENDRAHPKFERKELLQPFTQCKQMLLTIVGPLGASLIAINEVADFFESTEDIQYEWKFVECDYILPNILYAIVNTT